MAALHLAPSLLRLSPRRPGEREAVARLSAQLQAGEEAALERVLRELQPVLRSWMHRFLGPDRDVDDAVQDALVETASALPRFEGRSSVATLAYRVAFRVSRRHRRRPGRASESAEVATQIHPERELEAREALARVHRLLDRLPAKRREAFLLCALEGLTPTEAGAVLGVSANCVRSRLHRARRELQAALQNDGGADVD